MIAVCHGELRFEILAKAGDVFASSGDPLEAQKSGVFGGGWSLTRTRSRAGRLSFSLDRTA